MAVRKRSAQGEVTLKWWILADDVGKFEDELEAAFETKYPNIHIEMTTYPEAQFGTKVDTAIEAGAPPDVVSYPGLSWKAVLPPVLDDMVKEQGIDVTTYNQATVGTSWQENAEFGCSSAGSSTAWAPPQARTCS